MERIYIKIKLMIMSLISLVISLISLTASIITIYLFKDNIKNKFIYFQFKDLLFNKFPIIKIKTIEDILNSETASNPNGKSILDIIPKINISNEFEKKVENRETDFDDFYNDLVKLSKKIESKKFLCENKISKIKKFVDNLIRIIDQKSSDIEVSITFDKLTGKIINRNSKIEEITWSPFNYFMVYEEIYPVKDFLKKELDDILKFKLSDCIKFKIKLKLISNIENSILLLK